MLSGIVHEDDSARIQTVTQELNPTFATLLERVGARTGTGCVVNTSFNVKGQPLIMDPAHRGRHLLPHRARPALHRGLRRGAHHDRRPARPGPRVGRVSYDQKGTDR